MKSVSAQKCPLTPSSVAVLLLDTGNWMNDDNKNNKVLVFASLCREDVCSPAAVPLMP